MFYVKHDLNCKIVNTYIFLTEIEILLLEIGLTKRKRLNLGLYKTLSLIPEVFISEVNKNILLIGDFNLTTTNHHIKDFTGSNDF